MGKMKKILIFGCGDVGKKVKKKIESENNEVIAFTDNNKERWGNELEGKQIVPINGLMSLEYDYVAIGVYKAAQIIKQQLIDMGIPEEKIIIPITPVKIFPLNEDITEEALVSLPVEEYDSCSTQKYLSYGIQVTDSEFLRRVERLKEVLAENKIPRKKVCVVSGGVLQAHNLRKSLLFDDIDIIMTSDLRELFGKGLVIVSESAEMHPQNEYDVCDDDIIMDMNNHFIFADMKFMNIDILYRKVCSKQDGEADLVREFWNRIGEK